MQRKTHRVVCSGQHYPLVEIHAHPMGWQFYLACTQIPRWLFDFAKLLGPGWALQDDAAGRLRGRVISLLKQSQHDKFIHNVPGRTSIDDKLPKDKSRRVSRSLSLADYRPDF